MIKLCIFDLDGTLLNTLPTISYYCNLSLNKYGLKSIDTQKFKYLVGNGAKVLIEKALDEVRADKEEYFKKVYKFYNEEYDKDVSYLTKPYDGVPEMLLGIKTLGVTTAVLSNKPHFATENAVKIMFGELIDTARGGTDKIALKPSPDAVFEIIKRQGVKKEECIYIGDTDTDMQTGKNADLFTIGVNWGFRDEEELYKNGCDMIVKHPNEIYEYVKNTNK